MSSKLYLSMLLIVSVLACFVVLFSLFLIEKTKLEAAEIRLKATNEKFDELKTKTDAERAALLNEIETLNRTFERAQIEMQEARETHETRVEKINQSDAVDWLACPVPNDIRELFEQVGRDSNKNACTDPEFASD